MRKWKDFKKDAKEIDPIVKTDIEEMETLATIVSKIIERRNELGYSQRDLAKLCGLPHSSVARIETYTVMPKVDALIKIMIPLGLKLSAVSL